MSNMTYYFNQPIPLHLYFRGDFDIICCEGHVNKSPVILEGNNLALGNWCIKHVYSFAYAKIMENKSKMWKYGRI